MEALLRTQLPNLPEPRRGKVREVYDLGDSLLIVASDRISAFDAVMANGVPGKGVILNQMSAFWFDYLGDVCPNHVISVDDAEVAKRWGSSYPELKGRCTLAKKAKPLAIECVARGYITGSLYKEYKNLGGQVRDISLPEGLVNGSKLAEPIFTPATKAEEGHDENISFAQAADIVGKEIAERARDWTLALYTKAAKHAESVGIIFADTKFEFGVTDEGLILIDEACTPDSSRFWDASLWRPGKDLTSYDKQYLRDYLEQSGWNKQPPGPTLPEDVIVGTRSRYLEAFRLLTGRSLDL